jgi:diaminopimelate epimerase
MRMTLTKHHGLGNDFLVLFDDQPMSRLPFDVVARRLCDRREGVGADGLIIGLTRPEDPEADLGMVLYNADGGRAEISGNGIRCLAQAWARRAGRTTGTVRIATDAGRRDVELLDVTDLTLVSSVSMGPVTMGEPPAGWATVAMHPARPAMHLSVGNPHTVVAVDDVQAVDLEAVGRLVPDVNLEIVEAGPEADAITLRVHERGSGITRACGSGACAAAFAASAWGLVAAGTTEITVHMDGGDARVRVGDVAILVGPATYIATIEVP